MTSTCKPCATSSNGSPGDVTSRAMMTSHSLTLTLLHLISPCSRFRVRSCTVADSLLPRSPYNKWRDIKCYRTSARNQPAIWRRAALLICLLIVFLTSGGEAHRRLQSMAAPGKCLERTQHHHVNLFSIMAVLAIDEITFIHSSRRLCR